MSHLKQFVPRRILALPTVETDGWQLKRYAILADQHSFEPQIVSSALTAAIDRLPIAGDINDPSGNHGVGFQLIHFAEVAVVSPVFYWIWGSVLANTHQMRAQWEHSNQFETGVKEVVGCVWEMQILCYEIQAWKDTMLGGVGTPPENLTNYLGYILPSAELVHS